jgi:hypothetical protein
MADQKRLLELALKGLEAERQRIEEEIADIQKQIRGGGQRSRNQSQTTIPGQSSPAIGWASSADGKPTDRRTQEIVRADEASVGGEKEGGE